MYVNGPTGWRCAGTVSGEMRVKKLFVHAVWHVCMGKQSVGMYT